MRSELQKKKDRTVKKLLSDENFLSNLNIKQTNILYNKIVLAKSEKEIDNLILKAKKVKNNFFFS